MFAAEADPQEDIARDPAKLAHAPAVAAYTPDAPRNCRSPHVPDRPEVDCTVNPPGWLSVCPYTGAPFVAPPPPPPPPPRVFRTVFINLSLIHI